MRQRDGFVSHYSPDGTLDWSVQVGGAVYDHIDDLAVDESQRIFIVGETENQLGDASFGDRDLFVAELCAP